MFAVGRRQINCFARQCLEADLGPDEGMTSSGAETECIYQDVAALVKKTLSLGGALVLSVSQFEVVTTDLETDHTAQPLVFYRADLYESFSSPSSDQTSVHTSDGTRSDSTQSTRGDRSDGHPHCPGQPFGGIPALPILGSAEAPENINSRRHDPLTGDDHSRISKFLTMCTDGRIYEQLPSCFSKVMPNDTQYAIGAHMTISV